MLVAMPEQEWVDEERAEGEAPGGAQATRGPRPVGVDAARELEQYAAMSCSALPWWPRRTRSRRSPERTARSGASGSRRRLEARIPQTHPTMDFETDISR